MTFFRWFDREFVQSSNPWRFYGSAYAAGLLLFNLIFLLVWLMFAVLS